jgi:hypothetical protein
MTRGMRILVFALTVVVSGCAHQALHARELDRLRKPAFISRIEDDAGPRARVFREDSSYHGKLRGLDSVEADRRLKVKLAKGLTRFQLADRLRAATVARIGNDHPWTNTVDPTLVAKALQTYLVEEVPGDAPDYDLLRQYNADAIVEFVIQDYGMRSSNGHAGAYVRGFARLFLMDGTQLWRMGFDKDDLDLKSPHLDPLAVGQEPRLFSDQMANLVDQISQEVAKELNPPGRVSAKALSPGSEELEAPGDSRNRTGREAPPTRPDETLPTGELPPPDAPPKAKQPTKSE